MYSKDPYMSKYKANIQLSVYFFTLSPSLPTHKCFLSSSKKKWFVFPFFLMFKFSLTCQASTVIHCNFIYISVTLKRIPTYQKRKEHTF